MDKKESTSQECTLAVLKADHILSKSVAAKYREGTISLCSAVWEASSGIPRVQFGDPLEQEQY